MLDTDASRLGEQPPGAVDIHVRWATKEVAGPEPATLGCRRQRCRVHDGLHAGHGSLNTLAGCQVAAYPIDAGLATGPAGKYPHLTLLIFHKTHDVTAEMAGAAGDEYETHDAASDQVNRQLNPGSGRSPLPDNRPGY